MDKRRSTEQGVFHQNFKAHPDKNQTACQFRFTFQAAAEDGPYLHPGGGQEEGGCPDEGDGGENIRLKKGEGDAHRQSVDTGGDGQGQPSPGAKRNSPVLQPRPLWIPAPC